MATGKNYVIVCEPNVVEYHLLKEKTFLSYASSNTADV